MKGIWLQWVEYNESWKFENGLALNHSFHQSRLLSALCRFTPKMESPVYQSDTKLLGKKMPRGYLNWSDRAGHKDLFFTILENEPGYLPSQFDLAADCSISESYWNWEAGYLQWVVWWNKPCKSFFWLCLVAVCDLLHHRGIHGTHTPSHSNLPVSYTWRQIHLHSFVRIELTRLLKFISYISIELVTLV